MTKYTPTVDEVRDRYADGRTGIGEWTRFDESVKRAVEEAYAEFDRMIAEVEREAAARALEEAASWMQDGVGEAYNPSETDYAQQKREAKARRAWLRARAAEYRKAVQS